MDLYSKFAFVGIGRSIEFKALKVISIKLGPINIEKYKHKNVVKDFKKSIVVQSYLEK